MKKLLSYYCHYNVWANEHFFTFFEDKDNALLEQTIENSYPSIRKTIMHIFSAERVWLVRLQQDLSIGFPLVDNYDTTLDAIRAWVETSKKFMQFIDSQEDVFFDDAIKFKTSNGESFELPTKIMIHHCMNHSTYHRGQLITMARQLGMKEGIPSTDLLYYAREVGEY